MGEFVVICRDAQLCVSTNDNKLQQIRICEGACAQYHPSAP